MAAVESALVPLETDDTVDSVLAKVRATHSRVVQLLVPPDTAALQAPRGFERLRRALDAEGVSLLVFSVDEQVLAAARRSAIEVIAIDDGRTKRPPLPPRGPRGERTTQVLAETRLDPRDAAFIDALDQVPAHERYGDDPDADLYAALDDLSDVNQQLDREASREPAGRDLPPARVSHSAGAAERPSGARRYSADDIDLDDEEIDRPRARRSPTGRIAAADRLPQTQARRFSPALLLLLALVLVGLAGAAWVFANRTSITVAAPTSASADTPFAGVVIPLNPAGGGSGASVQAAPVSADVEASVAGAVQNETLSPSGTAKGEVTIVNTVESAVPLPKGSEFIGKNDSGEDVRFTLDSDVTVPGAQTTSSLAGRSTTFGQINVAVTARSPGSASNVGENAIKQILIPGQQPIVSDSSNFLIRHGPIGGGSEAPQRIVTEADVRGVLAEALTQLYNTGVQELRAKIDEGQFGIDATTITPSVADLSNPDSYEPLVVEPGIGQPVADPSNPAFRVTVRARFYALAAPRGKPVTDQLGPVVRDYFAQQTNSACKPGEVPSQTVERVRWDGERLTIDGVQHCSAAEQLAPETLAKVRTALRGQPREAAEASLRTLQQQGLIGDFQLPDRASFPRFDFLLDINVAGAARAPAAAAPPPLRWHTRLRCAGCSGAEQWREVWRVADPPMVRRGAMAGGLEGRRPSNCFLRLWHGVAVPKPSEKERVMKELGRVMALDVGGRRIGVALSDPTRTLASPLTTLRAEPRTRAMAELAKLAHDYEVAEVVVGLPLTLSGEIGPQAKLVQEFADALGQQLGRPMRLFDERLTSVAAERMMLDLGMKPEQRKARIDEVAASIILQDFLDSQRERDAL